MYSAKITSIIAQRFHKGLWSEIRQAKRTISTTMKQYSNPSSSDVNSRNPAPLLQSVYAYVFTTITVSGFVFRLLNTLYSRRPIFSVCNSAL